TIAAREAPELDLEVDSAGTAAYHVGEPTDPRTREAGARRGYDLAAPRARIVEPADFERFDLILAMDREIHRVLLRRAPRAAHPRLRLFMEFARRRDWRMFRTLTTADLTASRRCSTWWRPPRAACSSTCAS